MTHEWFDAHLDLGMLAEHGRDMHASIDQCRGRYQPAAVTLPSLDEGRVRWTLGTLFTEGVDPSDPSAESGPNTYPFGDAPAARKAGMRQLLLYRAWAGAGVIAMMPRRGRRAPETDAPLRLGVLMECADPIEHPDALDEWAERGVVAIGMAWWHQGRYASGNGTDPGAPGLTDLGRALAARMDELDLVHDASHLSQRALDELLACTDAPVIASHSNCRTLLGGERNPQWQRHLSDDSIREIARRGGVIGLNLVRNFIREGLDPDDPTDRPSVSHACDHIEHICELVGDRAHVGLGSDMDGGITADDLPIGIRTPSDLERITDELERRGWGDAECAGFAHANWRRFWGWDG